MIQLDIALAPIWNFNSTMNSDISSLIEGSFISTNGFSNAIVDLDVSYMKFYLQF